MRKKFDNQRFEFLFYINNNIICQRYFHIRGYNRNVINSVDIKYLMDDMVDLLKNDFKSKAKDYLWKYYNPYIPQKEEEVEYKNVFENEDTFQFEIKADKKTIGLSEFSGNFYPPKVRYSVDIRKLIPVIISRIQETLSLDEYEQEFCGIDLNDRYGK